jgi:superfamily II DNA/RNA helicase
LDQRERNRVIGLLRDGRIRVLVGTDVAARGLDIPGIDLVINVDVPRSGDDYLHRTGRTGRAGELGLAISLVGPQEWNRMEGIQRYLRLEFESRAIEGMAARFTGPGKRKKSTRTAAGSKVRKTRPGGKATAPAKKKDRHRDRKNVGKRRKPSAKTSSEGGFAPLKKKT